MTQTFRSRDDQVDALAKAIGPEKLYSLLSDEYRAEIDARALQHILEAEARGAAEERSKSVEGQEPVAWLYEAKAYESGLWVKCATAYEPTVETTSRRNIRPLYTRPANVAALEARVKVLEEYYEAAEAISFNASSEQCDRLDRARAALTREGGERWLCQ